MRGRLTDSERLQRRLAFSEDDGHEIEVANELGARPMGTRVPEEVVRHNELQGSHCICFNLNALFTAV